MGSVGPGSEPITIGEISSLQGANICVHWSNAGALVSRGGLIGLLPSVGLSPPPTLLVLTGIASAALLVAFPPRAAAREWETALV